MKEEQLELDLDEEKEYTLTLTESEINTISMLLSFVDKDDTVDNLHTKLNLLVDEEVVDDMLSQVWLKQDCIEEASYILPRGEEFCMYNNGYVLTIKE